MICGDSSGLVAEGGSEVRVKDFSIDFLFVWVE